MWQLSDLATQGILTCGTAGTSSTTAGGGPGLGSVDWPVVLGFMASATLVALISAGLTLFAARRLPQVRVPIPVWPQ